MTELTEQEFIEWALYTPIYFDLLEHEPELLKEILQLEQKNISE